MKTQKYSAHDVLLLEDRDQGEHTEKRLERNAFSVINSDYVYVVDIRVIFIL